VIDGKIVLGRTAREELDEADRKRIAEIDGRFNVIDRAMVRPIMAHVKGSPSQADIEKLDALEAEAVALRTERTERIESLSVPY
jgi:hypothetical protein